MLELFLSRLGQMIYLFSFIVIGFIVSKWKFVPENDSAVLSKQENIVFLPVAVMVTFINDYAMDRDEKIKNKIWQAKCSIIV